MDQLAFRHHVMTKMMQLYKEVDRATYESERKRIWSEISMLHRYLRVFEDELGRLGGDYRWEESFSDRVKRLAGYSSNATPKPTIVRSELSKMMERSGLMNNSKEERGVHADWLQKRQQLLKLLEDLSLLDEYRRYLDVSNPLYWYSTFNLQRLLTQDFNETNYQSLLEYYDKANREYDENLSNPSGFSGLVADPLVILGNYDITNNWLDIEKNRLQDRIQANPNPDWRETKIRAGIQSLLENRFCERAANLFWVNFGYLAPSIDELARRLRVLDEKKQVYLSYRLPVEVELAGSDEVRNTRRVPMRSLVPRFMKNEREPYRNTQVLCWRYDSQDPTQLGDMRLDLHLNNLHTVGILYIDDDGYPTPIKPEWLVSKQHEAKLQVCPDSGDVLLIERSKMRQATELPNLDPLAATWNSYEQVDHAAFLKKAASFVSDTDETTDDIFAAGMFKSNQRQQILVGDLSGSRVTGFFDLLEGRTYGFMPLPLGYGSISIKEIHKLHEKQNGDFPLCTAPITISENHQPIVLPRTIRQHTHELTHTWQTIKAASAKLYDASAHKLGDIRMLSDLHHWTEWNANCPSSDEGSHIDKWRLTQNLGSLATAIRKSIYNVDDPAEALRRDHPAVYQTELECVALAREYRNAVNKGFELLNDSDSVARINQWVGVQDAVDESIQEIFADSLDTASSLADQLPDGRSLPPVKPPQASWQPCQSVQPGVVAPYTPMVYEAYVGLLGFLSLSQLPAPAGPAVDSEQPNCQEVLLRDYLLPLVQSWVDSTEIKEFDKELREATLALSEGGRESYLVDALDSEIVASDHETNTTPSALPDLLKFSSDVFKNTFVRGPGAPALMQAVLDICGNMAKVRYTTNIHVQLHVSVRLRSLQILVATHTVQSRSYNKMASFAYRTLLGNNPRRMSQLLNGKTLSEFAYGPEWGNTRIARFEAWFKTGMMLAGPAIDLLELLGVVKEQKEAQGMPMPADPTQDDMVNALYHLFSSTETVSNEIVNAILVRNLMVYWNGQISDNAAVRRLLINRIEKLANKGGRLLLGNAGYTRTATLYRSVNFASVAHRLSVLAVAVAFGKGVIDTYASLEQRDELDAITTGISTMGLGATLAGLLVMNSFPIVGNALCIAGTVVCLAVEGWKLYWHYWGRSYWMGDSFAAFEDGLKRITQSPHRLLYTHSEYGASPELITTIREVKDQYVSTTVDTIANILAAFTGESFDRDVQWSEFTWCAIPGLCESGLMVGSSGNVYKESLLECIELSSEGNLLSECTLAFDLAGVNQPYSWGSEEIKQAKEYWFNTLSMLKTYAEENPKSTFTQVIWQALVSTGRYPGNCAGLTDSQYELEDLKAIEFPPPFTVQTKDAFLRAWRLRTLKWETADAQNGRINGGFKQYLEDKKNSLVIPGKF